MICLIMKDCFGGVLTEYHGISIADIIAITISITALYISLRKKGYGRVLHVKNWRQNSDKLFKVIHADLYDVSIELKSHENFRIQILPQGENTKPRAVYFNKDQINVLELPLLKADEWLVINIAGKELNFILKYSDQYGNRFRQKFVDSKLSKRCWLNPWNISI